MSEGVNLTRRDYNQIPQYEHDEIANAKRVVVVGQDFSIDSSMIAKAVKEGLSTLTLPQGQTSGEIQVINVPVQETVFIPQIQYKTLEVPVIVKEIEYREIEKPVIVEKIVTIEKPVYITEFKEIVKEKEVPRWQKICMMIQTAAVIGLLIVQITSHLK